MRIHHDVDPHAPPKVYGGLVYLTDTPPERGAFCCVPGIFREMDAWLERHPDAGVDVVDPEGHEIVPVPGRAGDMVLWDVRLPHANGRTSPRAAGRAVHHDVPPRRLARPAGGPRERMSPGARRGVAGAPGHAGVQPWPPAELTPLGRGWSGSTPTETRAGARGR